MISLRQALTSCLSNFLLIPKKAPFDLWNRERQSGLKLYVQRVFIMDDAEQFMPSLKMAV